MNKEHQYVWVLTDNVSVTVFLGFDHVRRTSKAYTSSNGYKMLELAERMAKQNNTEIIHNFSASIMQP